MNHDAKLAEPDTQSEIDYISGIASSMSDTFWIGGKDKDDEGTFVWASDNRNVTLFNWANGEPNDVNGGEDCVNVHINLEFLWNDSACDEQSRFVCEKQP
ncbi:Hypothetical predicted protein [Mytilus galloprovincialis]|uniref:C-type lectin domain-containing protein n=1 Tax=Mytilus galloprovincialis TaxID=29158 RepID=A0A8B6CLS9_MYTGA|nr:Hypothetical predicted protein [Mytilus galloprovincialis]